MPAVQVHTPVEDGVVCVEHACPVDSGVKCKHTCSVNSGVVSLGARLSSGQWCVL
jgi:hypothetical protein